MYIAETIKWIKTYKTTELISLAAMFWDNISLPTVCGIVCCFFLVYITVYAIKTQNVN